MGRRAEGYQLRKPRVEGGAWTVRFRVDQRRVELSTGATDRATADREGRALYAQALSGRRPSRTVHLSAELVATWLAEAPLREATRVTYEKHAAFWLRRLRAIDSAAIASYTRQRLREVKGKSIRSELSALRGLCRWLLETGTLTELPDFPRVTKSTPGTPHKQRRRVAAPDLTESDVRRVLAALPERSSRAGFVVADFYRLAYETGLRPSTLEGLSVPEHWAPRASTLRITPDIDKEGFAREVPLSRAARGILKRCAPKSGPVFGVHRRYRFVHAAAAKALPPGKARVLTGQHFRSARATHLLDAGAPLTGVQHLLGHRYASTTSIYVRPSLRAAEEALRKSR